MKLTKKKLQKITNIEQLRNNALDTLDKLRMKKISHNETGVIAKINETVMCFVRLQMEYSSALREIPNISFLEECHKSRGKLIESKKTSLLINHKKDNENV